MPRLSIAPFIFCAAMLGACSGGSSQADRGVAVIGDTPAEIAGGIAAAKKAGKTPLVTTVACRTANGTAVYRFSPYAQVLRSQRALVVRAFGAIYLFSPQSDVRFSGTPVREGDLPPVDAPALGGVCPPAQESASEDAALTDAWNGKKDPWQHGVPLVPWTAGAQLDALTTAYGRHP